jgi:acyl-CoA synthetase (AMP-forming)/AMP-acid ligase II
VVKAENDVDVSAPPAVTIVGDIFEHARAAPERTAVIYNGSIVSYGDFARRITGARRRLRDQGVEGRGYAVVVVDRLIDRWILGLALQSLGLTTIAIRSLDEIGVVADLDPRFVVVNDDAHAQSAVATGVGAKVRRAPADLIADAIFDPDVEGPAPTPGGHVLLTSGTTGSRKRVLCEESDEAINIPRRIAALAITGRSVLAAFDFGMWSGIGYNCPRCAWSVGAAALIHQGSDKRAALVGKGVTHVFGTPTTVTQLLDAPDEVSGRDDGMLLVIGGGAFPRALAAAASERLSRRIATYLASTEAGLWCVTPIEGPQDLRWHHILPGCEVQIVDEAGEVLPTGQLGRLRGRILGTISAYLNDPDISREYFADGYFYTGDLGVIRADGRMALHGRVSDVINFMGAKIPTAPIEQLLQERLEADDVCVFSLQSEGNDEDLHVVIQAARRHDRAELTAVAKGELKAFPSVYFHYVDSFPRNESGKIQRMALRQQLAARGSIR